MEEALLQMSSSSYFFPNFVDASKWVDPMRAVPFRFLGYGAALGEALRGVNRLNEVREVSYGTSGVFFMTHVVLNGAQAITNRENILEKVLDTMVFDTMATVFIPMLISSKVRRYVRNFLNDRSSSLVGYEDVIVWFPPVAAMTAVLLLSKPVDYVVGTLLDAVTGVIFHTTYSRPMFPLEPKIQAPPISPIAPIVPIAPICPTPKPCPPCPPCTQKEPEQTEDKKGLSVIITGHPDCNFNVTVKSQNKPQSKCLQSITINDMPFKQQTAERARQEDTNEATSSYSRKKSCRDNYESEPKFYIEKSHANNDKEKEPKFYIEKTHSTNAKRPDPLFYITDNKDKNRDCSDAPYDIIENPKRTNTKRSEQCPDKEAEGDAVKDLAQPEPAAVCPPIIFKNFNFLSSSSPRRPIYKDPYEEETTEDNASQSRISSLIESSEFENMCPQLSASVNSSAGRKCWSYERNNYHGGTGNGKSCNNSAAKYSDRRYD